MFLSLVAFYGLLISHSAAALTVEINPSQDVTAVKWAHVYLRCKVTGAQGKTVIQFARDGRVIEKPPPFPLDWDQGRILLIRPLFVSTSDGYYECIVKDDKEVIRKGIRVTVKDEKSLPAGFPQVSAQIKSLYPFFGSNFTLACDYTGDPKPEVTWFHGRKPVDLSNPKWKVLPNGSLIVMDTTREDGGRYECELKSILGIRYSGRDIVYPRPPEPPKIAPQFTKTLKDIVLDSEDSIWLSCAASGMPTPIFSWEKDGERIFSRTDGVLFVDKIIEPANFTCIASNMVGTISSTGTITIRGKPLTPQTPQFVKRTPSSITISWKPSKRELYPITYFVIQHRKLASDAWAEDVVTATEREFTLTKLTPYLFVTFRVIAVNALGKSRPSQEEEFYSDETVPTSPVYNLKGRGDSDTSVYVEWSPPRFPNGRLDGYRVYHTTDPTFVLSDWVLTYAWDNHTIITDLERNVVVYVKVQVYGVKGDGPMSNETIMVRALKGAPGPPGILLGKALSSKSVELSWGPPLYEGNGMDRYEIHYSAPGLDSEKKLVDFGVISTEVKGLKPFSNYTFKLAARSYAGIGPFSDKIVIQTYEDVPTAPPADVRARPMSSRSIEVYWNPPPAKDRNGIITGYKIMYTPLRTATPLVLKASADSRSALLMGLKKFTRYTIWMLAVNRVGEGPATPQFELFTEEDVPDTAPTDIRAQALNSSAVSVSWGPPAERSGRIQGYIIYCMPVNEKKEPLDVMPFRTVSRGARIMQIVLSDYIKPLQWYRIDVAAYNVKGDGVRSSKAYVKTPRKLPPSPTVNVFPNENKPEVTLTWRPRIAGVIGYKIVYGKSLKQYGNVVDTKVRSFPSSVRRFTFKKLARGVWYSFYVAADIQDIGWSSENIKWILTPEGRPTGAPANVKATTESSSSVLLSWEKPEPWKINGIIVKYVIRYKKVEEKPQWFWKSYVPEKDEGSMSLIIDGLSPNAEYAFQIEATTAPGSGPFSVAVSARTNTEVLPVVKRLQVSRVTINSAFVTWKAPPVSTRFALQGYRVEYIGTKTYRDEDGKIKNKNSTSFSQVTAESFLAKDLIPDMVYRVHVAVVTSAGIGQTEMKTFKTKRAAPKSVPSPEIVQSQNSKQITVHVRPASLLFGSVEYYALCVVDFGQNPSDDLLKMKPEDFTENQRTRRAANASDGLFFYVASHFEPSELPAVFPLGLKGTKNSVSNRPLTVGNTYRFFMRSFVPKESASGGYTHTSSPFSPAVVFGEDVNAPEEKSVGSNGGKGGDNTLTWITASVVVVVLIIGIVIVIFVLRKRRSRSKNKDEEDEVKKPLRGKGFSLKSKLVDPVELHRMTYQTPGMMSHPPISVELFESHVARLKKESNILFMQEYDSIELGQSYTSEASMQQCNSTKNRYPRLCAYDHSRIKLEFKGDLGSDYINANFVDGYCKERAYIATQGPLPNTINDFWRMCWEQRASTIVMMTQLEERGRAKCEQYWPSNGLATYGQVRVGMRDQVELAYYTMRTFEIALVDGHETREIKQFQFTAWPDPGVPQNPAPLLQFIRRVKLAVAPDSGPVVVHCSGGVGRTACYIVIDAMLDKIKNERKVDVYGYVTMLRTQRNFMVQTDVQYVFVHDVIAEAISSGNTEIPATHLVQHFKKLNEYYNKSNGDTLLEEEFKNIVNSTVPYGSASSAAQLPANKPKNRCQTIVPYDTNRVTLQSLRGHDGSDYINASHVDGYRERRSFIACQGAMSETVDDFWRMLIECNCSIIVMLTNLDEKGKEQCYHYWPKDKSIRYHYYVVDPVSETRMPYYVVREFKVTDARDGESRSIRQFQYLNWPQAGVPSSSEGLIELIGQVQKAYNQLHGGGPIVVHSSSGAGRTGVYIATCIILERLRVENVLDLFQTVKSLRLERPYMVQTVEQYQFCYQVAVDFLKNFDFVV